MSEQHAFDDAALLLAFGVHARAKLAGKLPSSAHPEPAYSSLAYEYPPDGSERVYACLADHRGLVAVYRLRASGRFVRMTRWPAWIIANDRDPEWREYCRRSEVSRRRRERRQTARFKRWADDFIARTTPPFAPTSVPPAANSDRHHIDVSDLAASLEEMDYRAA